VFLALVAEKVAICFVILPPILSTMKLTLFNRLWKKKMGALPGRPEAGHHSSRLGLYFR
jgi:hypothetical protein